MTAPYVIARAYLGCTEPDMHHWRVYLGGMQLGCVARSHQAAKRVALAYWDQHGEHFAKAMRDRIKEKWRGGLKAVLEIRNHGCREDARWYPSTASVGQP